MRFEASSAAKIGTGEVQWAPPSVDLLYIAAAWQPLFEGVAHRPPPSFICEDQAAYRSPFGAISAAGKLFTRKTVLAGEAMSCRGAMATGLLNVTPPSVDLTM